MHQCKRQSNFGDEYVRALHSRAEDSMETAPSWEVVMWRQALQQLPHWTPSHLPPGSNYPLFHFILHHCLCLSCCFGPRYRYQALLSYWTQSPSHPPTPCFEPKPFLIFSLQKMRENAKQRTKNGNRANRFFFLSLQIFWWGHTYVIHMPYICSVYNESDRGQHVCYLRDVFLWNHSQVASLTGNQQFIKLG